MANGPSTPALAAAASNAGGLGSVALAYLSPDAARAQLAETRRLTDEPFGANVFVLDEPGEADLTAGSALLDPYRRELGLPDPQWPTAPPVGLDDVLELVLAERPAVLSFTFGVLADDRIAALRERGVVVACTATTVREAEQLERAGGDVVVAQGAEAGGHRGTFATEFDEALVGTLTLVPAIVDAVDVPVVAAGGIMDGRGIAAVLALGADAAQLGTAFVPCPESGAHPAHKQAVLAGTDETTAVTRAFSGRPARGVRNRLVRDLHGRDDELAPFPHQVLAAADVRAEALRRGDPELMTMLAGQGLSLARELPAGELVAALAAETEAALARLRD